jgi:alkylation response protein AidB-like acyl-CoA dehydrogenase
LRAATFAVQLAPKNRFREDGVNREFPLARMWTSARTLRLADGADAVHRRVVAKIKLKRCDNSDGMR